MYICCLAMWGRLRVKRMVLGKRERERGGVLYVFTIVRSEIGVESRRMRCHSIYLSLVISGMQALPLYPAWL